MICLPSNRPPQRFYRGGARVARFRREEPPAGNEPEDWVASTTTVFGEAKEGLTRLPDGRMLRDAVTADPVHWLGDEHVRRWGDDTRLLVKLLDAGQRLPVHAHPNDEFAARHLGHGHGKAEAWYVLEGGTVHIGLRRDVGERELADMVARQDVDALLELLHPVELSAGDVVWVPPGELHAIGCGVLLVEVQQPEDLSILLEWEGFALDGRRDGHLGLGFDLALHAVTLSRRDPGDLDALVGTAPASGSVLPSAADSYFRLDRWQVSGSRRLAAGFAVIVVTGGKVTIADTEARSGTTLLVPASDGEITVAGDGEVLVARPPRP
ncbi:MAG: class I mannose-6-phosphate isomerase [Microbacterium sp.]